MTHTGIVPPQKRLKRLKLDIVLSWRQNIKQKRMLNQLNMECWNLCRGEPWMIVFKKLSCLIVFVRHGAQQPKKMCFVGYLALAMFRKQYMIWSKLSNVIQRVASTSRRENTPRFQVSFTDGSWVVRVKVLGSGLHFSFFSLMDNLNTNVTINGYHE